MITQFIRRSFPATVAAIAFGSVLARALPEPSGRFAVSRTTDIRIDAQRPIGFALDRLKQLDAAGRFAGKLDLQKVGIVGHSLGGATAAQFSHDDARCAAGVGIDGALHETVVRDGLQQPFLFLNSDHRGAKNPADLKIAADIKSVYERLPERNRALWSIEGANHFSFTDQMLLRSPAMIAAMQAATGLKLEPRRGLEITAAAVRSFLDVQLKGAPVKTLADLARKYPELNSALP